MRRALANALQNALDERYPRAEIVSVSAREGSGLEAWFERVAHAEAQSGTAMEVDYDLYAEGEALLGWMNCTLQISADEAIDGNALLTTLAAAHSKTIGSGQSGNRPFENDSDAR